MKKFPWIPISKKLPENDALILLSFENLPLHPSIGRYKRDHDGSGAFYHDTSDTPLNAYGIYVNAWAPLPECYRTIKD